LICEIDAITKLNINIISEDTNNIQDKINFEDARSMTNDAKIIQGEFNNKELIKGKGSLGKK